MRLKQGDLDFPCSRTFRDLDSPPPKLPVKPIPGEDDFKAIHAFAMGLIEGTVREDL